MRLLIDGTTIEPNPKGVGRYAHEVCCGLRKRLPKTWQLDLLIFEGNATQIRDSFRGNIIEMPRVSDLRRGLYEIPRQIKATKPDILLRLNESAGRRYSVPTVTVCHDIAELIRIAGNESAGFQDRVKYLLKDHFRIGALRESCIVLPVSQYLKDQLMAMYGLPIERLRVAHCGVDQTFLTTKSDDARQEWKERCGVEDFVLSFATGDPRENSDVLPLVLGCLKARGVATCLVIAGVPLGTPFATRLAATFDRHGLRDGADYQFLGFFGADRRAELASLYSASAVFLELSGHEGFGMQLAEAMATGTTCVSSGRGALGEVGGPYVDTFPSMDPELIASRIQDLLNTRGNENRKREQIEFAKRYSWTSTVSVVLEALQDCSFTNAHQSAA